MSVLNKKPFIKTLLESMTTEDIGTLSALMDGEGDRTSLLKTLNPNPVGNRSHITDADLGVHMCSLEVNFSQYNGYLIYNSDFCILLQFTDFQRIQMFNINPAKNSYELVDEYLDINELRSELDDTNQAEKVEIIDVVNKAIEDGDIDVGGMPEATAPDKVLVSNEELGWDEKKSAPLADNLTSAPTRNEAIYSNGPTGGLADISTGEEAYLQEVKGYSIVWNQLLSDGGSTMTKADHIYIRVYKTNGSMSLIQNSVGNNQGNTYRLYDLTLMFGGNDKIPFSLTNSTEYPQNGSIPEQQYQAIYGFARLFANVDLAKAPYNAGTIKNVSATKLVESGQNLWDASTMEETGLRLLAGYRYEVYYDKVLPQGYSPNFSVSIDNGQTWTTESLSWSKVQRADGKYICYIYPTKNCLIKSMSYSTDSKIAYVGFVHSGNYCLTSGTNTATSGTSRMLTDMPIPPYVKHEFNISGINGLNGIPDDSSSHCSIYDTKDVTRIGSLDLSTLEWTDEGSGEWKTPRPQGIVTTAEGYFPYLSSKGYAMDCDDDYLVVYESSSSPTGTILYQLAEPIATGQPAFEPIPLKDNQGNWIVNDMGSEYFAGLDVCPVNQVSYYYENLKDKLVNLQQIEVEVKNYRHTLTDKLEVLEINGKYYKNLPLGDSGTNNDSEFCIAIGQGSYAGTPNISTKFEPNIAIGYYAGLATTGTISNYTFNHNCIAIGLYAGVQGGANHCVHIGNYANSYTNAKGVVAIGASAVTRSTSYAIAIGWGTTNVIESSVCFDGTGLTEHYQNYGGQRTLQMYSPGKIFFRNETVNTNYTSFGRYTQGHFLNEYIQNNVMVSDGTKYYISYTDADNYKTFTGNKASGTFTAIDKLINGVHITVVLTDNDTTPTWHSVVGMDLMLYDSTNSLPYNSYARIDCGGTVEDIIAYIDADGCVVITAPTGTVISSVKYNIK